MALKATIFKADVQIADMDRHYYQDHNLTLARHPSETDGRMMVRLLAFMLNASEDLAFTKGLSTDDEPELWRKNLVDEVELWIEVGLPDEKRIRKACNRAAKVIVYSYGGRAAQIWWDQLHNKAARFANLSVCNVPDTAVESLGELVQRSMRLQCNIQDGQIWLSDQERSIQVELETWKS